MFDPIRLVRRLLLALAMATALVPSIASAEVKLIFWSRDTSNYFPHAFVTVKGTLDATGERVDNSFGFTLNDISPLALFGPVPGHIDIAGKKYIRGSTAQFSVMISDAQYAAILDQVAEWGADGSRWSLNKRNCVHFAAEVARRAGLAVVADKRLMKKPKSFTRSLIPLNEGRVTVIDMDGAAFWAQNPAEELFGVPEKSSRSTLEQEVPGLKRTEADR